MKTIRGLCEDLTDRLDLPEEALLGTAKLTVTGNRRVLVENHRGILEYGTEQIRISTGRGQLVVRGSELSLSAMNQKELIVCGKLQAVEWE